MILVFRNFAQN